MHKFGDMTFHTKKDAKSYVQSYLKKAPIGLINDADTYWILDLLQNHPRWEDKSENMISLSIQYIYGNNAFFINKTDGTSTDISYIKCFDPPTQSMKVNGAFRAEIKDQVETFKTEELNKCADNTFTCLPCKTQMPIDRSNIHVDHHKDFLPFSRMVQTFMSLNQLTYETIETIDIGI